jgi:hypothetical protein
MWEIILKNYLKQVWGGNVWIDLARVREQRRALVNTIMNLSMP